MARVGLDPQGAADVGVSINMGRDLAGRCCAGHAALVAVGACGPALGAGFSGTCVFNATISPA